MKSRSSKEKNFGVIIQDTLSSKKHINGVFSSAYKTLRNTRVYMDMNILKKIITSMTHSMLKYAAKFVLYIRK